MNNLRQAAQQALDAMTLLEKDIEWQIESPTLSVLRKSKKALSQALAEPEKTPEELGYVPLSDDGTHVFIDGIGLVPLAHYAPTPRKPLTDEQKLNLVTNWFAEDWAIKKALGLLHDYEIDANYGTGEQT